MNIKKVIIFFKYINYVNVFLLNSAVKLFDYISINNYPINLINNKQSFYRLIYSLKSLQFKILKTYIKTQLANGFIKSFKLFVTTLILFIYKKNNSF